MPKLESFEMEIRTGDRPGPDTPRFNINGFPLDFDAMEGGTGSGETLKAVGSPGSFPHALTLSGPEEGSSPWDIESVRITYACMGIDPYTVRLGAIALDDESDLNIWHERPAPVFDV
jgi:hypothetical protein